VTMRLSTLDLPEGNAMRAPGETPGMMALEIAMDEMAEKLKLDPIEFRIINDTQVDPTNPDRPFSKRQLVECLRTGADRFGWSQRHAQPGTQREGRWLIGMGVAVAFRNNLLVKSGARVRLDDQGNGHRGNRHDRYRHRQLHHHRPDRRGNDGCFPRQGGGAPGRFELSGVVGSGGQFGGNCSTAGCMPLASNFAKRLRNASG
jgi:xanthine dehydrogenase YagR molybdenum-binding subunit